MYNYVYIYIYIMVKLTRQHKVRLHSCGLKNVIPWLMKMLETCWEDGSEQLNSQSMVNLKKFGLGKLDWPKLGKEHAAS